jgi:MFS family permease
MLGLASLLTDMSSEMIYPLLPVFLAQVLGAGALALGVIEGVADTTTSLLKVASGWWADRVRRRKPLVVFGYGLAGLARPLIGLAGSWPVVLALRFTDRIGKGVRGAPRDALIADVTPESRRGAAFGLHRAMDHAGAVAGPLVAAALLSLPAIGLRGLFLLSALPAALVLVVLVFGVREEPRRAPGAGPGPRPVSASWRELGGGFRRLLLALVVFTLGNSTDAFLLLALTGAGVPATGIALLWALHHVVKMTATYLGGRLSDRWGRRSMVVAGWTLYALVYLGFALAPSMVPMIALFLAYGVYFGFTEPVERAWVVDLAPERLRGTALGLYHGAVGIAALPASLLFGILWKLFGAAAAFATGASLAMVAALLLVSVPVGRGRDHLSRS